MILMINDKIIKGFANGEIFFEFYEKTNKKSSNNYNRIILNNAKIHHYGNFKEYMNKQTNEQCIKKVIFNRNCYNFIFSILVI